MSKSVIFTCDICRERILAGDGVGLVFRSHKPGEFDVRAVQETDGSHICWPCLTTLTRGLVKQSPLPTVPTNEPHHGEKE